MADQTRDPDPVPASLPASVISDEESRAAMRAFLQRCEVRLSTIHRVGQALLGGSALILLLPLFLRDGLPNLTTLLISAYDGHQQWITIAGIAIAAAVSILLPIAAIYLLVGDLLGFYFTSNTFGAPGAGDTGESRPVFNPRFIVPGLGFNTDELNERTSELIDEGRADEWTRALLVPRSARDEGWRDRFDTRMFEVWGMVAPAGPDGDAQRLRQSFRLAGLHHDRTLAGDVTRTEALLSRHVLTIRIAVLRYTKALLLLVATTVATLVASGLVGQAERTDPTSGHFTTGFPYRYLFIVALVYVLWAPAAARSVTAPLRMIQRHTPGVGEYGDVYLDKQMTQFESVAVFATFVSLVGAGAALITAGAHRGPGGLALGIFLAAAGAFLWVRALGGHTAGVRQTLLATWLLILGRDAPNPSKAMHLARARESAQTVGSTPPSTPAGT